MNNKTTPEEVVISIATFRRPAGLNALLDALCDLQVPPGIAARIVVVDNSPEGMSLARLADWQVRHPLPLDILHEPRRGLAQARNAGLEQALVTGARYLAFIDDDEVPDPDWLCAHLSALRATGAMASIGAVRPRFVTPPPAWLTRGRFLELAHAHHAPMRFGCTSNTLIELAPVRAGNLRFDPLFDLTGGEDTAFFEAYQKHGGHLTFSAAAAVDERIPPYRASARWLWRRWRRTGQTNARLKVSGGGWPMRARCAFGGLLRIGVGGAMSLLALPLAPTGHPAWAHGLRIVARGAGYCDAVIGRHSREYARRRS
ncbi:glycosyltransferase family 2 protein [Oceanibium sediminis]|uniref:glycosyltransferase family 2 protein n=1 Tax=Oceanibium sediminis TaxID=2026339 RepID=UPI000DD379F0|nr:glycosyltransferase family 2 protein [Oceanibium sediminis]